MTQKELDKQACIALLERAVESDSLTLANLLIESAHRLDNTVPVEYYIQIVRENWQVREFNRRKEFIK